MQAAGVARRLHHDRWYGRHQHRLSDPGYFAATGGVADVDGIAEIQVFDNCGRVGDVVVHVVAVRHLARAPVAAAIDTHNPVAVVDKE
jgi:hypothetical protein